jgi:hypothetical protein
MNLPSPSGTGAGGEGRPTSWAATRKTLAFNSIPGAKRPPDLPKTVTPLTQREREQTVATRRLIEAETTFISGTNNVIYANVVVEASVSPARRRD